MAPVNRARIAKLLDEGLNTIFGMEYDSYPDEWKEIFATNKSRKHQEEDVKISGLGLPTNKAEGQSIDFDEFGDRWTKVYRMKTIALGFVITEEAMEDNLYQSQAKVGTQTLARSFKVRRNMDGAAVLNYGFTGGEWAGGDGQPLFSASHPTDAGNFDNLMTTAQLNETSLEQACIDIAGYTDDRGMPIMAKGVKLIVPRRLQYVAERIVNSQLRPFTANNDTNVMRNKMEVCVNHFLTSQASWFVKTDVSNGFKHFERVPISFKRDDGEFNTGSIRFKARERYDFGFSDPRAAHGNQGA